MALQRESGGAPTKGDWIRAHAFGLACAGIGLVAIAAASSVYMASGDDPARIPDVRLTAPFLVAALAATIASLVRREGAYALSLGGCALAGAAMVLGWFIVVGAIALAAALIILVMHAIL